MSRRARTERPEALRRLPRYPAYKDSGVEWLGEIPAHWEARRIRHVVSRIEQGWSPDCENREANDDEWGVLKAGCVNRGVFLESENKALPSTLDPIAELEIHEGDLLMSRASGSRELVGSVAVAARCRPRLLLCDKLFRLHVDTNAGWKRFLAYALNSRVARWQIEVVLSGGSGLANNIAQEVVKDLVIAQPARNEQRAIAAFLDRETARIDPLVAKKERLIELLLEKRTALITRAVTKGIDPSVPMKDSGVEWVEEIPAHWELKRIRDVSEALQTGPFGSQLHADEYVFGGHPVVNPANLRDGELFPDEDSTVDDATAMRLAHHRLLDGDILFARRGEMGRCGLVVKCQEGWLCGTGCLRLRVDRARVYPRFLRHLLSTHGVAEWLSLQSVGTTMQNLNTSIIARIPIVMPPLASQVLIAAFLDRQTLRLDALIAKVGEASTASKNSVPRSSLPQ